MLPLTNKETITSLALVEQINLFRNQEKGKSQLRHDNLLSVIRDEFEEEIGLLKIKETPYTHP
jgi:anti-repressor protein